MSERKDAIGNDVRVRRMPRLKQNIRDLRARRDAVVADYDAEIEDLEKQVAYIRDKIWTHKLGMMLRKLKLSGEERQ